MRISVTANSSFKTQADYFVCLCDGAKAISVPPAKAAAAALAQYAYAVKAGRMKRMDVTTVTAGGKPRALALVNVPEGSRKRLLKCEQTRMAAHEVYKYCKKGGSAKTVFFLNGPDGAAHAAWIAEGLELGAYAFTRYKKKDDSFRGRFSAELVVAPEHLAEIKQAVKQAVQRCQCVNWARDLINEAGSVAVPAYLAQAASEMARERGLDCDIWDERRLEDEGYTGLLTVGKGGIAPPRMIVLRHRPQGAPGGRKLCLVGKGVTFDTGGICLKPPSKMLDMIGDMCGAAAVLAAMKAIALSGVSVEVTGIIVCAQNAIGSRAMLPGDCFKARNGKTIQVENTDAEGRLILTDGFARAGEDGATHIVDVATLTGACERALGDSLTGLFANDSALAERLLALGAETGEEMWRLPLYAPYREDLDHWRADLNNIGKGPNAGAITAALFLEEFLPKGAKWAHLDIAGTSFDMTNYRYYGRGGRGAMVRTMVRLAEKMATANEENL